MVGASKVDLKISDSLFRAGRVQFVGAIKAENAGEEPELDVGIPLVSRYVNGRAGLCVDSDVAHHAFKQVIGVLFPESPEGFNQPVWYRWLCHQFG